MDQAISMMVRQTVCTVSIGDSPAAFTLSHLLQGMPGVAMLIDFNPVYLHIEELELARILLTMMPLALAGTSTGGGTS
jgi:hypothetical protein